MRKNECIFDVYFKDNDYLCKRKTKPTTIFTVMTRKKIIQNILDAFPAITLEEMGGIRLMNRTDTKFVTTIDKLKQLLIMAQKEYMVQEVDGVRDIPYYTLYFDTVDFDMFCEHEHGHSGRQKVRIRSYVNSGLHFLEVKTKDNHGRTKKERVVLNGFDLQTAMQDVDPGKWGKGNAKYLEFLETHQKYPPELLRKAIENRFSRITLVNNGKTERLTIDTGLEFVNMYNDNKYDLDGIAVIELKRNGLVDSPVLDMLNELRIKPNHFSKYCMGTALTNTTLPINRFKLRLRAINKMMCCDR